MVFAATWHPAVVVWLGSLQKRAVEQRW